VIVSIPWPVPVLWPNNRAHWAAKAKRRKAQKEAAWALTLAERTPKLGDGRVSVTLTFRKADRGRYDLDGALSACKGALDGIALALGVDDSRFDVRPVLGDPVAGGAVIVEVGA
jgi:crossover junction endodeoxyribonuclease RusA